MVEHAQARIKEIRKELAKQAQKIFLLGTEEIFEDYPTMNSFSWVQYTPYFCDGDPCYFGVYCEATSGIAISTGTHNYLQEFDDIICNEYDIDSFVTPKEYPWYGVTIPMEYKDIYKAYKDIDDFINGFHTDDLQIATDYAEGQIIIYRDGTIEVEEYAHD